MTTPARHLPPRLIDARADRCPDVFTVQCTGSIGTNAIELHGKTPMGCERRTVCRAEGESDEALWARVETVVKHFKDQYGFAQRVAVICYYDLTPTQGAERRAQDDRLNAIALLKYIAGISRTVATSKKH